MSEAEFDEYFRRFLLHRGVSVTSWDLTIFRPTAGRSGGSTCRCRCDATCLNEKLKNSAFHPTDSRSEVQTVQPAVYDETSWIYYCLIET